MEKVLKDGYEKKYQGIEVDKIRNSVLEDEVVQLVFAPHLEIFLDLLGWDILPFGVKINGDDAYDIDIEIEYRKGMGVAVKTYFPRGNYSFTVGISPTAPRGIDMIGSLEFHTAQNTGRYSPYHEISEASFQLFLPFVEQQLRGLEKIYNLQKQKPSRIVYRADAIRVNTSIGYRVWPKMGFDAITPYKLMAEMHDHEPVVGTDGHASSPAYIDGIKWIEQQKDPYSILLSDIYLVEDEAIYSDLCQLWATYGETVTTEFDYTPGSNCLKLLARCRTNADAAKKLRDEAKDKVAEEEQKKAEQSTSAQKNPSTVTKGTGTSAPGGGGKGEKKDKK